MVMVRSMFHFRKILKRKINFQFSDSVRFVCWRTRPEHTRVINDIMWSVINYYYSTSNLDFFFHVLLSLSLLHFSYSFIKLPIDWYALVAYQHSQQLSDRINEDLWLFHFTSIEKSFSFRFVLPIKYVARQTANNSSCFQSISKNIFYVPQKKPLKRF